MHHIGAGRGLEALERHVGRAADAAGGDADLFFLRQRDQVGKPLGIDLVAQNDRMWHVAGERYGGEILQWIVAELGLHEWIDGERSVRADEERVAVGFGARDSLGADTAARAATVVDQ